MKKVFLACALILVLVVTGFLFWPRNNSSHMSDQSSTASNTEASSRQPSNTATPELIIGKSNAKATIIEYGDFKCPNCNKFYREAEKELRNNYVEAGKLKIVWRNLPYIGPDSFRAAEGSYCADEQQSFADYHDALFDYIWNRHYSTGDYAAEQQDVFTQDTLSALAKQIGIDTADFNKCLASRRYQQAVNEDLKASQGDGASGTPFFVIGNQKVTGVQPYGVLQPLVELQLR